MRNSTASSEVFLADICDVGVFGHLRARGWGAILKRFRADQETNLKGAGYLLWGRAPKTCY